MRSHVALEAGADAAGEVEQPEALRPLVRLALGDGQRVARAVEVAEGAAQPARVALPPVDDVEACRVMRRESERSTSTAARRPSGGGGGGGARTHFGLPQAGFPESGEVSFDKDQL